MNLRAPSLWLLVFWFATGGIEHGIAAEPPANHGPMAINRVRFLPAPKRAEAMVGGEHRRLPDLPFLAFAIADQDARLASEGAQRTGWMVIWLLAFSALAGAVIFMVAVNRTISRPLMGVGGSIGELAEGNTATNVPGQERSDEIGKVASAIQIFKEKMIQAEHIKADQATAELRAAEQRKSDMLKLADDFENAVGQIVLEDVT